MLIYDSGFKIVARTAGRALAEVAGFSCARWTSIVSEVQTTERLADRAFRASKGSQRFVVYMEGYTYWLRSAPWNILAKSALLSERERLPTVSLLYVLRPRGYRPQGGQFQLRFDGAVNQHVSFREICLWQIEPQPWWESIPGLMALYPLSRHSQPAVQAVQHGAEVIADNESDGIVRADLLTTLAIFGKLAYPRLDVIQLIGREQMRESKLYEEIKAEGREEGWRAQRAQVLETLEFRFGDTAVTEFGPRVNAITDFDKLIRLHRLALRSANLQVFQRRFDKN